MLQCVLFFLLPGEQHGAVGQGFSIGHMAQLRSWRGREDQLRTICCRILLIGYDTSSGQMNSEQSLVAGTHSHGKFSLPYRNKVMAVCWHAQWHNHDGC